LGYKGVQKKYNTPIKSLKRWELVGSERVKGGGRKPLDPELFGKMTKWYEECRKNGTRPNTLEISRKAIQISRIEEFKGSKGWVSKFLDYMKRHGAKLDDDYPKEKYNNINNTSNTNKHLEKTEEINEINDNQIIIEENNNNII